MTDFLLKSSFSAKGDQIKAIDQLCNLIDSKKKYNTLLGVTGSGKTFTMANVIESLQRPALILSHNKTLAAQLYGEFKSLFPNNAVEFFISYYDYYQPEAYLPVTDTFIEKDSSIDEEIDRLRLKATASLASRKDVVIISSVSCIYGIGSPENYNKSYLSIDVGKIEIKDAMSRLIDMHYIRNDMVLEPGTFRLLGENFEIFPIYDEYPIRVELFADSVEYIYRFDPISGKELDKIESIVIYPAKHFMIDRDNIKRASNDIHDELKSRIDYFEKENKLIEAQRIKQRTLYDLEMMMELGYCSGIENYSRHLDGRNKGERPFTLIDFFPSDFITFIDESHVSLPQVRAMYNGDRSRKETLISHGFRLPSALDNRPMKYDEFDKSLNQVVYVSATPSNYEIEKSEGEIVEQIIRPTGLLDPIIEVQPTKNQIDCLISEINLAIDARHRVLITTLTKKMAEDLSGYLKDFNIKSEYLHSDINTIDRVKIIRSLRKGEFDVLVGINLLREGLDIPEVSLVAVIDADKEGFLRSETSLMQLSGRAARNVKGKVILFADKITKSMNKLIKETKRRREIQKKYNLVNKITPKTISKSIQDINLSTRIADEQKSDAEELKIELDSLDKLEVENLKKRMFKASRDLQFEKAAVLRDKIDEIQKNL